MENQTTEGKPQEQTATGQNIAAVDALTDAFITGEAPAEIQRLEAAVTAKPENEVAASVEQKKSGEQAEEVAQPETVTQPVTEEPTLGEPALDIQEEGAQTVEGQKIRLKGEDMRIARMVKDAGGNLSWAQAEALVKGKPEAGATEQAATEHGQPAEIASQKVEDLRNEYATVVAQLDEAAQNETLFTPEIRDLQKKERELERQIGQAEQEVTQATSTQQREVNDQRTASFNSALGLYADLKNQDSALWKEAKEIATNPKHPDFDADRNTSTKAPLTIAKIAAANLGIKANASQVKAPVISSVSQTEQTTTVRPASGQQSTAPKPPKLSPQEIAKQSEMATLDVVENGRPAGSIAADRPYILM